MDNGKIRHISIESRNDYIIGMNQSNKYGGHTWAWHTPQSFEPTEKKNDLSELLDEHEK